MPKRVLDVGNCAADHGSIRALLARQFAAEVVQADSAAEALEVLRREAFDLVLVNRVFDVDGDDGLEFIRAVKSDAALAPTPIMLITNYPDFAQEAVQSGAAPGFGKRDLGSAETVKKLGVYLSNSH
jgi:two-component system, chemotaxis family, chemotaxis protein CheY